MPENWMKEGEGKSLKGVGCRAVSCASSGHRKGHHLWSFGYVWDLVNNLKDLWKASWGMPLSSCPWCCAPGTSDQRSGSQSRGEDRDKVWTLDRDEKLVKEGWRTKKRTQVPRLLETGHRGGLRWVWVYSSKQAGMNRKKKKNLPI